MVVVSIIKNVNVIIKITICFLNNMNVTKHITSTRSQYEPLTGFALVHDKRCILANQIILEKK